MAEPFLYHLVPRNLVGSILYPLNELKQIYPELYASHAAKYVGRESLMQQKIPALDCLWNDVLQLSPVHPQEISDALKEAGSKNEWSIVWFEIPSGLLEPSKAVIYGYDHVPGSNVVNLENFVPFAPSVLDSFSAFPQHTKDYYKIEISQGRSPLLFSGSPHVLYRGRIDISNIPLLRI